MLPLTNVSLLKSLGPVIEAMVFDAVVFEHRRIKHVAGVFGDNGGNSVYTLAIDFVPKHEIVGRSKHAVLSFNDDNVYRLHKSMIM